MNITSENYRDALRHFASGVTIVTIKSGEQIHGLTVSAFASISPEPPLIAIIIDHRHHAHQLLEVVIVKYDCFLSVLHYKWYIYLSKFK